MKLCIIIVDGFVVLIFDMLIFGISYFYRIRDAYI